MAFKTNYRLQRADRNRAKQLKAEEKLRERQEQAAKRKTEQEPQTPADGDAEPTES